MRQPVVLVAAVALLLRLPPLDAMLDDAQQQPPPGCPSANPATTCSVGFIFNKSTGPSPYGTASYDGFVAAGNCSLDTASSRPCWLMCQEYADAAGNCDAFYLHITTAPPSATNTQVECRIYHGVPTQRIDAATNGVDPRSVVGCTTQGLIGGDGHDPAIIAACCKTAPPPPPADNSSRWHCGADFSCVVAQAGKPGVPKETCMQSCYAPAPPPPENTLLKSLAVSVITGDRQDHSTMRMLIPPFSPTIYDYYLDSAEQQLRCDQCRGGRQRGSGENRANILLFLAALPPRWCILECLLWQAAGLPDRQSIEMLGASRAGPPVQPQHPCCRHKLGLQETDGVQD